MSLSESVFTIVEENNCPFYQVGDQFVLYGNALLATHKAGQEFVTSAVVVLPQNKQTCRLLVSDLTRVLIEFEKIDNIPQSTYPCSGCIGTVTLSYGVREARGTGSGGNKQTGNIRKLARLLHGFSVFSKLSEENVFHLASLLQLEKYSRGAVIIKKGEPGKNLFIIAAGQVEVLDEFGNRISKLGKGEIFGEMSLLSGEAVGANIRTLTPVSVLTIGSRDFRRSLQQHPTLQMYFAQLLAQRLAQANMDRTQDYTSGMSGKLSEMPPAELFQTLHSNQKTGVLTLIFQNASAAMSFRDGGLLKAEFKDLRGKKAFFAVFKESRGRFKFVPGLPPEDEELPEIGYFMQLLLDGVRQIDEEN